MNLYTNGERSNFVTIVRGVKLSWTPVAELLSATLPHPIINEHSLSQSAQILIINDTPHGFRRITSQCPIYFD